MDFTWTGLETFDGLNKPSEERMLEIMRTTGSEQYIARCCVHHSLDYSLLNALPKPFSEVILLFCCRRVTLIGAGYRFMLGRVKAWGKSFVHYCTIKGFYRDLVYFPFFLVLGIDGLLVAFLTLLTALL